MLYRTPRLTAMAKEASRFYLQHDRPDLFAHSKNVLIEALRNGTVRPELFGDGERGMNELVAQLALIHPLEFHKVKGHLGIFPSKGRRAPEGLEESLARFSALRNLDETPGDIQTPKYAAALREGEFDHNFIALLARIIDLSAIADHAFDNTYSMKEGWKVFHLPESIRARESDWPDVRKQIATAALKVYAPFAERFGFRRALNLIREGAYNEINPAFCMDVKAQAVSLEPRIMATTQLASTLLFGADGLVARFEAEGKRVRVIDSRIISPNETMDDALLRAKRDMEAGKIDVVIKFRSMKSLGSILEKLSRRSDIGGNLEMLHDLVAFTVITETLGDTKKAFELFEDILIRGIIERGLPFQPTVEDYLIFAKNSFGYRSKHLDAVCENSQYVNFEAIFRTREMDEEADHGAFAHWVYKGVPEVHGTSVLSIFDRLTDAMRNPVVYASTLVSPEGPKTSVLVTLIDLAGEPHPIRVPAYTDDTWLDIIGLALPLASKEMRVPIDPTKIGVEGSVALSSIVGPSDINSITLRLGGTPPLIGSAARRLASKAHTKEGAELMAQSWGKIR